MLSIHKPLKTVIAALLYHISLLFCNSKLGVQLCAVE